MDSTQIWGPLFQGRHLFYKIFELQKADARWAAVSSHNGTVKKFTHTKGNVSQQHLKLLQMYGMAEGM